MAAFGLYMALFDLSTIFDGSNRQVNPVLRLSNTETTARTAAFGTFMAFFTQWPP